MIAIVNATPHSVAVWPELTPDVLEPGHPWRPLLILPPSGIVPRAGTEPTGNMWTVGEVPVVEVAPSAPTGLPPYAGDMPLEQREVIYLVSTPVLLQARRGDLVACDRYVRDRHGEPLGCRGLVTLAAPVVIVTGDGARTLMAPYLGDPAVELALDSPCADEPGKVWLVATIGGEVAGWSAAVPGDDEVKLATSYVLPAFRRRGVYRRLFAARLEIFAGRALVGWAADESLPEYLRRGFKVVDDGYSETGHHWTEVRRAA